jgi:hypothetical protein
VELRLTQSEQAVLRELTERDSDAAAPRMANAYRRLVELSRSNDPVDGILVAHLSREILSALPGALGIEFVPGRLEYEDMIDELAASWPADIRASDPPVRTVTELRRLLEEHERASGRARLGPRALLSREDRARTGYVPETSLDRWIELSRRGSGLAHRLRNPNRELPGIDEVRRLVDELTATLLATIAPYFAGIREIDRLLGLDMPDRDDARQVANLLRTASQSFYFFERAHERWLEPLAGIRRFLTTPPGLLEVGGGYVQAPAWPQGRFLARVAGSHPELVAELVERIPATTNPRVVAIVVQIATALPRHLAARLAPDIGRRMAIPLAVEYAAVEAAGLVRELCEAGFAEPGAEVLVSVIDASIASPRDDDWHLERALEESLEAVANAGADIGLPLSNRLRRLLGAMGPRTGYSTIWLPNVDRRPRYGVTTAWLIANALYRVLLTAPLGVARSLAAGLITDREPILNRIALAAVAERSELVESSDAIALDPSRWDDAGSTRYEFRRALASLWSEASENGRRSLLEYAERAEEAAEIVERLAAQDLDYHADTIRREWRSRLLYKVRDQLPREWLERNGPLAPMEDDRNPEPTVRRLDSSSPFSREDLAGLEPEQLLARIRDWSPPAERAIDGPTFEGFGRVAAEVILDRLPTYAGFGAEVARLPSVVVAQVTFAIEHRVRESEAQDREMAVEFVVDLGETYLPREVGAEDADTWSQDVKRNIADTLAHAANKGLLSESEGERAFRLIGSLIADPVPTGASNESDVPNGYDAGMLALNSVRGQATTAAIELLVEAHRRGWTVLLNTTLEALRIEVAADHSRSVRGAIGLRLPWLLARDEEHQRDWLELLFGGDVPESSKTAAWQAYLLYSRFFSDTVTLLRAQYDAAVLTHQTRPQDDRGRPRDEDEQLGVHVALAHLLGLEPEHEGHWLDQFYGRAAGWVRGRVTRWIAEQAASASAQPEIRARARAFLDERVAAADPEADAEELKAVAWIAPASDEEQDVLNRILLPALEKTRGVTENEPGAAGLAARLSVSNPRSSARVIQLLVEGDQWHSLPHVASAELRRALEQLMRCDNADAQAIAEDVINTLGAQGFLEFRELIDGIDLESR